MITYVTYKFRIYPNDSQKELINKTIGANRFIYNYFLEKKSNIYKDTKFNYPLKDMLEDLKYLTKEYTWLSEVDSISLRRTLFNLDDAFKRFFKNISNYPKYKRKGICGNYQTNCIRSTYKGNTYENIKLDLIKRTIKLPKLGIINIKGYRKLNKINGRIMHVTVSKKADKYYVNVLMEEIRKETIINGTRCVGIDLGVKDLIITSDGIKYKALKTIKKYENKIKGLNKWLSRCERTSKNRLKVLTKLERAYQKLKNARKNYTDIITKKIIDNYDYIFIEDLSITKMIENAKTTLTKKILDSTLNEIVRKLEYKTKWNNKTLIKVDRYFKSSQKCCICGNINKETKNLNVRNWKCSECNTNHDRDINASINILFEGLRLYYKNEYGL